MRSAFCFTTALVLFLFSEGCISGPTASSNSPTMPPSNGLTAGLPPLAKTPLYTLDKVGDVVNPFTKQPVEVKATSDIDLSGFAVDGIAQKPAGGVDIVIDGLPFRAHYGISRPDVAQYFKVPEYSQAGYSFSIAARYFGPGPHKLAVRVVSNDQTKYCEGPLLALVIK